LKKSSKIELGLLAALALSLTGCRSSPDMQRCVDETNVVQPEEFCSPSFTSRYHWGLDASGQRRCLDANNHPVNNAACSYTVGHRYHWYYGGRGSYAPGSVAYGGADYPRSGSRYATGSESRGEAGGEAGRGGTSRGGFGRAGAAAGGRS
jgi:hypothetical protein